MALGGVCDVTDLDSVEASVEYMVEAFGGLQLLVNVAGVGRAARFEEIDEREWERTLAVNLTGVFHTTKAALPHLLAAPRRQHRQRRLDRRPARSGVLQRLLRRRRPA